MSALRTLFAACLLPAATVLAAGGAIAADTPVAALPAVNALVTARDVARLAEQADDPLLMVAAARLIREHAPEPEAGDDPLRAQADRLLLRAQSLSEMKPELLRIIEDLQRDDATRGLVGNAGVRRKDALVKAGATDVYTLEFEGDEDAAIVLWGDGLADVDLEIQSKRRKPVCASATSVADEQCRWHAPKRAEYRVRVTNRGDADSRYVLLFN